MKKLRPRLSVLFSLFLTCACLVSCTGGQNQTEGQQTRKYSPAVAKVDTLTAVVRPFRAEIISNGKVSAARRLPIYPKTSGIIQGVNVKNGQRVQAGTILARLDDRDVRAELKSATIAMEKAELDLLDNLAGQGFDIKDTSSIPDQSLKVAKIRSGWSAARSALDAVRHKLDATTIRAPFSGRIANLAYSEGDRTADKPLCILMDESSFSVDFNVLESEVTTMNAGMKVEVVPYSSKETVCTGSVTGINPSVDNNGQVQVTAQIPGQKGLIDGMNVRVVASSPGRKAIVVPKSALVIRDNLDVLFRYNNGVAEWVYVNILDANDSEYAIEANASRGAELREGEAIIISGNLNLADGSSVEIK